MYICCLFSIVSACEPPFVLKPPQVFLWTLLYSRLNPFLNIGALDERKARDGFLASLCEFVVMQSAEGEAAGGGDGQQVSERKRE